MLNHLISFGLLTRDKINWAPSPVVFVIIYQAPMSLFATRTPLGAPSQQSAAELKLDVGGRDAIGLVKGLAVPARKPVGR